jgi:hypothetical protein
VCNLLSPSYTRDNKLKTTGAVVNQIERGPADLNWLRSHNLFFNILFYHYHYI